MNEHVKNICDAASLGVAFAAFLKYLPAFAAFLSVVWTFIRIYEWWQGRKSPD